MNTCSTVRVQVDRDLHNRKGRMSRPRSHKSPCLHFGQVLLLLP